MIIPYERYEHYMIMLEEFSVAIERYQFIYDHLEIQNTYEFDTYPQCMSFIYRMKIDLYAILSVKDSIPTINYVNLLWIKKHGIKKHQLMYENTMKDMILIFKNYPKLNIEELCQEAFKPSRVMYSINCDPEWDN